MAKHLTAQDLAERWSKSPEWITEQARQGHIPGAWKLGRHWRFDLEEIEAYGQSGRTQIRASEDQSRSDNIFALTPIARRRQKIRK